MTLDYQLRRGSPGGIDIEINLGTDLSTKQYRAIAINVELTGTPPMVPPAPPVRILGILQNAPQAGELAVIRFTGWTLALFGDTVSAGDLLKVEELGTYDRLVPFVMDVDGHNHKANAPELPKFLVYVTNLSFVPVTGLTSADIIARQWIRSGGTITEYLASTSVTEDGGGGGWYEIAVTSTGNIGDSCRISVDPASGSHLITPREHQLVIHADVYGPPVGTSYVYCMGQALQSGAAGDTGLIMLRPHLF